MNKPITNRYDELSTLQQVLVNNLINTIAGSTVGDLVLHRAMRDCFTAIVHPGEG